MAFEERERERGSGESALGIITTGSMHRLCTVLCKIQFHFIFFPLGGDVNLLIRILRLSALRLSILFDYP